MKLCPKCGVEKSLDKFGKSSKSNDGLQGYCQCCMSDSSWRSTIKKRYGITPEKYDAMYAAQEGRCQICQKHQTEFTKRLAVDHCHTTGKVRGLLCSNCNTALGKFNDDIELFSRAISYLRSQDQE